MGGAKGANIHVDHEDLSRILREVTAHIVESQNIDTAGWSADPAAKGPRFVDVWTTSQVILWMDQVNFDQYREQIDGGIQHLIREQGLALAGEERVNVDGGWGWRRSNISDTTATSLALRALLRYYAHLQASDRRIKESIRDSIINGRDWLIRNRHGEGGFALFPTDPHASSFNTCWCSIALKACADSPDFRWPAINSAIQGANGLVLSTRPPIGWGREVIASADPLGVAYCTYLLQYFGYVEQATAGAEWLRRNQEYDEDIGYWLVNANDTLEPTAWALIALLTSGERPDTLRIQGAVKYLRKLYIPGKGWPERFNDEPTTWASYYAFLALTAYIDAVKRRGMF